MKLSKDRLVFNCIAYFVTSLFALLCVLPFIMMLSGSLSSEEIVLAQGYSIIPKGFTTYAYEVIFADPKIVLNSFAVSLIVTISGTFLSLLFGSMTAYALCRKDFKNRNKAAFLFYFTTLFNGGLVPYYILVIRYLNLKNNILILIIPQLVNVFNILVLRNFMKNDVPDALPEAAKIDGAGEFRIYWSIVLPLMKPALMAIGFFTAIGYWNDWYSAMLFIDDEYLSPLQYTLYKMLNSINFLANNMSKMSNNVNITRALPQETVKLSMAVVAALPVIFIYPFIQKFFIKGITIGAVKG